MILYPGKLLYNRSNRLFLLLPQLSGFLEFSFISFSRHDRISEIKKLTFVTSGHILVLPAVTAFISFSERFTRLQALEGYYSWEIWSLVNRQS